MKKITTLVLLYMNFSGALFAQQPTPQLLKEPAAWEFERFAIPPVFAPAFPYHGVEELRFAPGMFKKDSTDYFTYAFVAQVDSTTAVSQEDVENYLLQYFKGLCISTARERKLVIDETKITVSVKKKKGIPANEIIYNALLHVFGVFVDGAPVKLNAEVKLLTDLVTKKSYLIFITSPQEKTGKAWEELYRIQRDFKLPA